LGTTKYNEEDRRKVITELEKLIKSKNIFFLEKSSREEKDFHSHLLYLSIIKKLTCKID